MTEANAMSSSRNLVRPPWLLIGEDESAFPYITMRVRVPKILERVLEDLKDLLGPPERSAILKLKSSLECDCRGTIEPISCLPPDQLPLWSSFVELLGLRWFDIPWLRGEIYVYWKLLEATGYFSDTATSNLVEHDPFIKQKTISFEATLLSAINLIERLYPALSGSPLPDEETTFRDLIQVCLWGNRVDLSLFHAHDNRAERTSQEEHYLLVDRTGELLNYVRTLHGARIDIILDNYGFELLTDLLLAEWFLCTGKCSQVVLHCKDIPFFVSDTMPKDISLLLECLKTVSSSPAPGLLAAAVERRLHSKEMVVRSEAFWTAPLEFYEMPTDTFRELSESSLVICKGDLNYRRLVGDRHWEYTTDFASVMQLWVSHVRARSPATELPKPFPIAALRTLKAPVIVGLAAATVARLAEQHRGSSEWLVNGEYGVIEFWNPMA